LSLFYSIQTGSGDLAAYYLKDGGALSLGLSARSVKLTTHLHLVARSRILEVYLQYPIRLLGVVQHSDNIKLQIVSSGTLRLMIIAQVLDNCRV
jgi:hypothetical protein